MLAAVLCTTAVEAQNAYNYQKRSHYAALPVHRSSIVFLGDSITDYGDWSEWLGNPRVINRGISGDRAEWMLDRLDPIVAGQPAKLFLMIGTNDLAAGATPDAVAANICKVVDRILAESPRTKLYVQSVFPVNGEDFEGQRCPRKIPLVQGRADRGAQRHDRACMRRARSALYRRLCVSGRRARPARRALYQRRTASALRRI